MLFTDQGFSACNLTSIAVSDLKILPASSANFYGQNLPVNNLNQKTICTLLNCGGIAAKYTIYFYLTPTLGSNYWLDINLSGGTAFTLEVFACSLQITYPTLLANE